MQVILHTAYMNDPFSVGVALLTGYPVSHASVVQDGEIWDTTIRRGWLDVKTEFAPKELLRSVMVFDFPEIDATEFLQANRGRKYDYWGIALWLLGKHSKQRWYCFEVVSELLRSKGIAVVPKNNPVTGRDLFNYFTDKLGMTARSGNTRQLIHNELM